jgi:hypothetical protein
MTFSTVLRQSCAVFCRISGFTIFLIASCGIIMKLCGFAICGLANIKILRIFYSGMSPRICGLATADYKKCLIAHL